MFFWFVNFDDLCWFMQNHFLKEMHPFPKICEPRSDQKNIYTNIWRYCSLAQNSPGHRHRPSSGFVNDQSVKRGRKARKPTVNPMSHTVHVAEDKFISGDLEAGLLVWVYNLTSESQNSYCHSLGSSSPKRAASVATVIAKSLSSQRAGGTEMRKTALITGITGQDGSYLAEFLLEKGCLEPRASWLAGDVMQGKITLEVRTGANCHVFVFPQS